MIGDEIQVKTVQLAKDIEILNQELFLSQTTVEEIIKNRQTNRVEELFDLFEKIEILRNEFLYKIALVELFDKFNQPIN